MTNDRFIDIPGGSIHCTAFPGIGPAAHFSHANGCCAGTYALFLEHLAGPHAAGTACAEKKTTDTFLLEPARRLARFSRDCRIVTIPRTGHFLPMEAPQVVGRAILRWCERNR